VPRLHPASACTSLRMCTRVHPHAALGNRSTGMLDRMKSAVVSIGRSVFISAACLSAVACVRPLPDTTPPLVESRTKDIVLVIDVMSVRSFERDGCFGYELPTVDGGVEVFCASDPPFKVLAKVVTRVYGPWIGATVSFKTHSHWGTRPMTNGNLKLVHLVTDGNVVIMPDEEQADVGADTRGVLFVPAHPHDIEWLPCGTNALKKHVIFQSPGDRFSEQSPKPMLPSPPEVLTEDETYYLTDGDRRYPRFGIPVDSISRLLHDTHPDRDDFRCYFE
jgi:hypothetical protein